MSPFKRGDIWWGRILGVQVSLQTTDKQTALQMAALFKLLKGQRFTDLLEAVRDGPLGAGSVWDAHRLGTLDQLRASLHDIDVASFIPAWMTWAGQRASAATVLKYERQLRALIPAGTSLPRSQCTRAALAAQYGTLAQTGSTKRRYHAAWSSFFTYLVEIGILELNPMTAIRAPKGNPPKELWLEFADVERLVHAQPSPFRELAAFREGSGAEVSAALRARVRDVKVAHQAVFARGTKNVYRNREVLVEGWAWPAVLTAMKGKLPDAYLFPVRPHQDASARDLALTEDRVRRAHQAALKAVRVTPRLGLGYAPVSGPRYTVHDARHSYAVRRMQAGDNPEDIASNLGHADATMVLRVYGKYRPTPEEKLKRNSIRNSR